MSIIPRENDVIHGKGYAILKRPGNIYYRTLINSMKVDYDAAPKSLKGIFAHQIVNYIYSLDPPGRFLANDPKTGTKKNPSYMIVQKSVTIQKTRQTFRDAKVKKNLMSLKNLVAIAPAVTIRTCLLNQSSRASIPPIAPEKSDAAKKTYFDGLQEENADLKRRLARMEREMKSMIVDHKLAYPNDVSSESIVSRDSKNKDSFDFDMDLDMFLETERNRQAPRKEATRSNVRSYEKVATGRSSEGNESPSEHSTKSSKLFILGKFASYVQKVRYSLAMRVFGARTDTDINEENTRMELRLKTMQLLKKYMIKKQVDRLDGKLKH